jgi:hypothetical protein
MLTARLPFGVGDALAILARQLDAPPPPPSSLRRGLAPAVDAVITKAMAVDPDERYATPGAFAAALRTALRGAEDSGDHPIRLHTPGQLRELTVDEHEVEELTVEVEARPTVRGATFRVAAKVLAARLGEPALRRIAELRRHLAPVLMPNLPPMSWEPLDLLLELVEDQEIQRTVGRGMVSVTFGHLYGADITGLTAAELLGAVPQLWSRYFGAGRAEVVAAGDDQTILRVDEWPAAGGGLIAGFLERIAELTGVTVSRVAIASVEDSTVFTVEWSSS